MTTRYQVGRDMFALQHRRFQHVGEVLQDFLPFDLRLRSHVYAVVVKQIEGVEEVQSWRPLARSACSSEKLVRPSWTTITSPSTIDWLFTLNQGPVLPEGEPSFFSSQASVLARILQSC